MFVKYKRINVLNNEFPVVDKFSFFVNLDNRVQRIQTFHFCFSSNLYAFWLIPYKIINKYQYCYVYCIIIIKHNYINTIRFDTITCPHMVARTIHTTRVRIINYIIILGKRYRYLIFLVHTKPRTQTRNEN